MSINFPSSSFKQLNVTVGAPQARFRCDPDAATQSGQGLSQGSAPLLNIDTFNRKGFQRGYTAQDAAISLWQQENTTFRLDDPVSLDRLQDRLRSGSLGMTPSEQELSSYMEDLRQNGLDGTVDWNVLSSEFHSFQATQPSDLAESLDYMASRYVAVLDKLERNFTGDALAEQKAKLEEVWQDGTASMISDYISQLQEGLGVSEADALVVKDSFSKILKEKVTAYQDNLPQTSKTLVGPDSNWLQNCDAYIAAQLREKDTESSKDVSATHYSVQDLVMAGKLSQAYQTEVFNTSSGGRNEVTLALNLAMADMKSEEMISRGLVSDKMAALLRNSRAQGHENALKAADERLSYRENTRLSGEAEGSFAPINKTIFQGIYQTVMTAYKENGGNGAEAIRAGANYGQTVTSQAHTQNPTVARWGMSMKQYWKDFYTTPTTKETTPLDQRIEKLLAQIGQSSGRNNSTYQNYVNSWCDFMSSIGGGLEMQG